MIACPIDLDLRHIKGKAGECLPQGLALGRNTELVKRLLEGLKVPGQRRGLPTLAEKRMKLIHGTGLTGHVLTTLQG
jgi:hypothetical protein